MNLNSIKSELERLNYYVNVVSDTLIIGTDPKEIPDFPGGGVFKAFCSIEIHEDVITVEYGQASLSKEKRFSSMTEAVEFIKGEFEV